jgi:hypothetical protein
MNNVIKDNRLELDLIVVDQSLALGSPDYMDRVDAQIVRTHFKPEDVVHSFAARHQGEGQVDLKMVGAEFAQFFALGRKFRLTLTPIDS